MMLLRSPIKAAFVLVAIFSLLFSNSKAQQSQECISETIVLHSNVTLLSSAEEVINGTLQLQDPATCSTDGSTESCSFNFATQSANFEATCTEAGGQTVTSSLSITCTVNMTESVTYLFTNTPNCIGMSCNTTASQDELKNFTSTMESALDDVNSLSDCLVSVSTSAAPTIIIGGAKVFLIIIGNALLASTFLF